MSWKPWLLSCLLVLPIPACGGGGDDEPAAADAAPDAADLPTFGGARPAVLQVPAGYDPAVPIIPTPLAPSASWNVTSTVSGVAQGVAVYYTERYVSRVDAIGDAATPFGPFPVRRIAVDLTRTVGAVVTTRRSFACGTPPRVANGNARRIGCGRP